MKKIITTILLLTSTNLVFAADVKKINDTTASVQQPDIQLTLEAVTNKESQLINRLTNITQQYNYTKQELSDTQALKKKMQDLGITQAVIAQ